MRYIWIPEPKYHYKIFTEEELIRKCMIAMMIKFYDERNKCVIGGYSLDGDDFILKKG